MSVSSGSSGSRASNSSYFSESSDADSKKKPQITKGKALRQQLRSATQELHNERTRLGIASDGADAHFESLEEEGRLSEKTLKNLIKMINNLKQRDSDGE